MNQLRVAIVGTSYRLSLKEQADVKKICIENLKKYPKDTIVVSGGARGVDTIAINVARELGFKTKEYLPETYHWEDREGKKGFKSRNLEIENNCDELYCISIPKKSARCIHHNPIQDHEQTAGCWTLNLAKSNGKPCKLFVTPKN